MASLIEPGCATPIFQMSSLGLAKKCGGIKGFIIALVISIIITIVAVLMYNKSGKFKDQNGLEHQKTKNKWILIIGGALIVMLWIVIPFISRWMAGQQYKGFQDQIKSLMNKGYSKQKAIDRVQSLQETKTRARATRSAGLDIASAIIAR